MKYLLTPILCSMLYFNINAQISFSRFYDFNRDNEGGWKIIQAKDKYIVVCGNLCDSNTVFCSGLLCFDKDWNLEWKKTLDSLAPLFLDVLVSDNEFIYYVSSTDSNYGREFYLMKFDLEGNVIKKKYFGPFEYNLWPYTLSIDSGYLYLNVQYHKLDVNKPGYDSTQVWYMDKNFELIYSFTDTERKSIEGNNGFEIMTDGNYCSAKFFFIKNGTKGLIKKFDASGNIIWTYSNEGISEEYYQSPRIRPTSDSGCVGIWSRTYIPFFNDTFPQVPVIFKLDKNGNLLWTHTFYSKYRKFFNSIIVAKNGDIIGIGNSESFGPGVFYKCNGWLVRFSSEGKLLWEHTYNDPRSITGWVHFNSGLEELATGNLVMAGSILPKTDPGIRVTSDAWIVRMDADGCIIPSCDSMQLVGTDELLYMDKTNPILCTNPIFDQCFIQALDLHQNIHLEVYSINGIRIKTFKHLQLPTHIDLSSLTNGMYIFRFLTNTNNLIQTTKIIKL
ncbi:MAG: T9SS type A sorting domain-containing protein [Saprospiraceae bacterium]|jgi:hypothetical protein|nr:T9SS type A sorting domain-containing protein [Saprospiraceae bacterium]